jgi:hypothetical protein
MSVRPKKRRDSVDSQKSDDSWNSDDSWKEIVKENNKLFDYMTANFQSMYDGDLIVKHFEIRYEYTNDSGSKEIMNKHGDNIQKELIPWIYKEYREHRLFDTTNWMPFRDSYNHRWSYLGYKILFNFQNYYFKLGIEEQCDIKGCVYCQNNENQIHFQLKIYGWKENENDTFLKPFYNRPVPSNNIIPDKDWIRKNGY